MEERSDRQKREPSAVMAGGALVASFFASICCIGPLAFAALGVGVGATGVMASTAGILKALLPYRPAFIGLTLLLLGISFYLVYRRPGCACVPGRACDAEARGGAHRAWFWIMTACALVLLLLPAVLGL